MKIFWTAAVSLLVAASSIVTAEDVNKKFCLYNTKGREWTQHFFDGAAQLDDSIHYEIKSVKNNVCEVKETTVTVTDKGRKKTKNETFKFTMDEKNGGGWVNPPEGAKKLRDETIQVMAGKFDCTVYDVAGETHYMSKVFPGLLVKRIQPGLCDLILVEFDLLDGDPPTSAQAATPKENPTAGPGKVGGGRVLGPWEPWPKSVQDFRLYKTVGRKWEIIERVNKDTKWEDSIENTYEITGIEKATAKMKVIRRDLQDKKADVVKKEEDVVLGGNAPSKYAGIDRRPGISYAAFPDRKIKVKAGVFDCFVVIAFRNQGRITERDIYYVSKEYPGLQVFAEKFGRQYELVKFERDKDDKGEGKDAEEILSADSFILPEGAEPPAEEKPEEPVTAELNWSLYEKVGRKWTLKRTSIIAEKEQVSYTDYEVTDLGLDSCSLKATALDAKKKPAVGGGNVIEIQFNADNAYWCGPIATQEKTGEETIEAAGQKWECIVYKDTKSVKDAVTTSWMSKKYPGLWVKSTTKGKYNDSTTELVEFTD